MPQTKLKKLFLKIYQNIMIPASILIFLTLAISFLIMGFFLLDSEKNQNKDTVIQGVNMCNFAISNTVSWTKNIALRDNIIKKLTVDPNISVIDELDSLTRQKPVIGVTLYSLDGSFYTSSQIRGVPDLETLLAYKELSGFVLNPKDDELFLRNKDIFKSYNGAPYPDNFGIITYVKKVYKDDNLIGILFTDMSPEYFYNTMGAETFIRIDDEVFYNAKAYEHQDLAFIDKENYKSFMIIKSNFIDNSFIICVISQKEIIFDVILLGIIFLGLAIALIFVTHYCALKITKSVVGPLDNLLLKMKNQNNI